MISSFLASREQHLDHLYQVCTVLRKEELYPNPKKCALLTTQVHFLGFVISSDGVSADPEKEPLRYGLNQRLFVR